MAVQAVSSSPEQIILPTSSTMDLDNRMDHLLARLAVKRDDHRVEPGLYSLGNPSAKSPVFVTSNYTLSFDALRCALAGIDGYILVLDTQGINVWCAAGKGTFGTDELVRRIEATQLRDVVNHRVLILPQLGAPGVAAHEVKRRSGFRVQYGPVRAGDLPAYLKNRQATPEMRRVRFPLRSRVLLIPVELVYVVVPALIAAVLAFVLGGALASAGAVVAALSGTMLFPILLPGLPTPNFSTKGLILGGLVAVPFGVAAVLGNPDAETWLRVGRALPYLLIMPPATAYLALNFTGSSTFTSRTGVRREMFAFIPTMAWMGGAGILATVVVNLARIFGRA